MSNQTYRVTLTYLKEWVVVNHTTTLPFIPRKGDIIRLEGYKYRVDSILINLDKENMNEHGAVTIMLDES